MDATADDREHLLVEPGRQNGPGGHAIASTFSSTRNEGMSAADATWYTQHRLQMGHSAPTVNGAICNNCTPDGI